MPTSRKIFAVQNLVEKVKQAKAFILTDYSGLKVSQINQLRAELKKVGAEFEVVKNTLLKLALGNKVDKEAPLTGPTAALWLYEANPSLLKPLTVFISKNELPKIKLGFWEGELISPERVMELASLPSLKELQAKLVGLLNSPAYRLTNSLNWNLKKLVFVLKGVKTNG